MKYKIVSISGNTEKHLNRLADDGWRVQETFRSYGVWTFLMHKDDSVIYTQTVAEKKTVSFDLAVHVLRIATKRAKLLREILQSSKAFGYEVIIKKIEAAGLLLEEEDEEKELENDCRE